MFPCPSVNVSTNKISLRVELPLFSTVILYSTISPAPILLSPLSATFAVFVTSKPTFDTVNISVWSSLVFPSVSSPSSLMSVTSPTLPGLLPVNTMLFLITPVSEAR